MFKFFQSFYSVSTLFPSVRFDSLEFCLLTITNTQLYFGCTSKTIAKVVVCPYCHYCLCYLCHLPSHCQCRCCCRSQLLAYLQAKLSFSLKLHTLSIYCCSDFSLFVNIFLHWFSNLVCHMLCVQLSLPRYFFLHSLSYHNRTFNSMQMLALRSHNVSPVSQ